MVAAVLMGIIVVLVPGYVILRVLGFGRRFALCASPAMSAAYVGLMGIVYGAVGVRCSLLTLAIPLMLLAAILLVGELRPRKGMPKHTAANSAPAGLLEAPQALSWGVVALYAALGLLVGYYVFVRSISFSDGMIQAYDVVFHVNKMRAYAESGIFSSFRDPIYAGTDVSPFVTSTDSFYPSAFHAMAALLCMTVGTEPTGAINVMSYLFSSLVLPLSLAIFLAVAVRKRSVVVCGSVVSTAFALFPWTTLRWGPIFPNMAALAAMFAVVALWCAVVNAHDTVGRARGILAFLLAAIGLALLQPNAAFAMGVVAAVYLFSRLLHARKGSLAVRGKQLNSKALAWVFLALCCILWVAVIFSPFLHDTVNYEHPAFTYPAQAVINVLTLSFVFGYNLGSTVYPQYVLAFFVVAGFVVAASNRRTRWLCLSFVLSALAFIVCVSTDGTLKHLMSGPWYNDPYRIGSVVCLCAMPLAAEGVAWLVGCIGRAIQRWRDRTREGSRTHANASPQMIAALVVFPLLMIVVYYPNFSDPETGMQVLTAFGYQKQDFASSYDYGGSYSKEESDFVREAKNIVGDQLVLNLPEDGSVASYGFDGLHCYYREVNSYSYTAKETEDSLLIRHHLSEIATDQQVQQAVQDVGATYVLKLSAEQPLSSISWEYDESDWDGFLSITDDTPGFETVLAEGDYRLYRISY